MPRRRATGGIRTELAGEALWLGRVLTGMLPREPEVHGLVALMGLMTAAGLAVNEHERGVLVSKTERLG